jgi:aspartate/methionine/tyrosine aminotransferase
MVAQGETIIDLISGNVSHQNLFYPQKTLKKILAKATHRAKRYHPHPLGQAMARKAVCDFYLSKGIEFDLNHILLTPGTSISYWYCFQLLANPGDEILCPKPSYPLFEYIAALCGIRLTYYPLHLDPDHPIAMEEVEAQITSKSRAIILISPHNPTGIVFNQNGLEKIATLAKQHQLPLISDEVFSEFLFDRSHLPRAAATQAPLVFTLNGFSKMFALPGLKIGWMVVSGKRSLVEKTVKTLEMISDTFLPVGEVQQFAVRDIFREGKTFLKNFTKEIQKRRNLTLKILSRFPHLCPFPPQGGFYLTIKLKKQWKQANPDQWVLDLLTQKRILIHPGYFYDMEPFHLVTSFVSRPMILRKALQGMGDYFLEK